VQEYEKYLDKIKSNAANLYVVAAFYVRFSFFDASSICYILFDQASVASLVLLNSLVIIWSGSLATFFSFNYHKLQTC